MCSDSANRGIKMKSISLEDLRSIVKRMISGTINDTEQMANLHRAIYEELYFEKRTEFEGSNEKKNSSRKTLKAESIERIEKPDEGEKNPSEDPKAIFSQREAISDWRNGSGNDRNIDKIDCESLSKIQNLKEDNIVNQRNETNSRSKRDLEGDTERNDRAFETWKRAKTISIRKLLKEERRKKREELEAREADIEKKRAFHEAYLRLKKRKKLRPKCEETPGLANDDASLAMRDVNCERIITNEEVSETSKYRKDNHQLRRCCYEPRKVRTQIKTSGCCNDFDLWLNRLDSVLHQKYLRERRYLVRSFYCQPAYYGTAALSIQ